MTSKLYGIHLKYGDLILFGENLESCKSYINDCLLSYQIDTVEDVCIYCSRHGISIAYMITKPIYCVFEYLKVRNMCKKYSVYASWSELLEYDPTIR